MRITIAFFVSYAHADQRPADSLMQRLTEQLAPSKRYAYTFWRDTALLVGERWHDEIQEGLTACQLGLLLITPAFLTSKYITQNELPQFVGDNAKPVVPVMLKTIDLQRHDTKGLEAYQLFRLDNIRSFADCPSDAIRRRFVEQLFVQIERRLDQLYAQK